MREVLVSSLAILACVVVAIIFFKARTGPERIAPARRLNTGTHILIYLAGAFAIFLLVVVAIFLAGPLYQVIQDDLLGGGAQLDVESYVGIIGIAFGIPVAFAGSIYAIYLAILGLHSSDNQVQLANHANMLADPSYETSQRANAAYQQLGFLIGSLLVSSRSSRQVRDCEEYVRPDSKRQPQPSWTRTKDELRELMYNEAFVVAALTAARQVDKSSGSEDQQAHQHRLRRAFANVVDALGVGPANAASAGDVELTQIMVAAALLEREIRSGIEAVKNAKVCAQSASDEDRLVGYLQRWMPAIGRFETGRELSLNIRALAFESVEFAARLGALSSIEDALRKGLDSILRNDASSHHAGVSVAALLGDHETVSSLEVSARRYCEERGYTFREVLINKASDLDGIKASSNQPDEMIFHFVLCPATKLALLQEASNRLGSRFIGCVIIDGARSPGARMVEDRILQLWVKELGEFDEYDDRFQKRRQELLESIESDREELSYKISHATRERLQMALAPASGADEVKIAEIDGQIAELREKLIRLPSEVQVDDLVGREIRGPRATPRFDLFCKAIGLSSDGLARGQRSLWVAIDYRQLGVRPEWSGDPEEPLTHFSRLFNVLGSGGLAISEELDQIGGFGVKSGEDA